MKRIIAFLGLAMLLTAPPCSAWSPGGVPYATRGVANMAGGAVSDGAGGAIFIWTRWTDSTHSHTELRSQRIDASGAPMWSGPDEGVVVCDAPGTRYAPKIIPDGHGGAFAVWFDQRQWPQIYATRFLADGSMAPGWPPNGLRVAPTGGPQFDADIAADGAGGAFVMWSDWRDSFAEAGQQSDIYIQRLTDVGSISPSWPFAGIPVSTARHVQDQVCIIPDGDGGVIGCWRDERSESTESYLGYGDIYAQRILWNGSVASGWPEGGLPVGAASYAQNLPAIVPDDAGGAIVAWRDYREDSVGNPRVFASRVSDSGQRPWGTNGVRAGPDLTFEWIPTMVSDGSGGAYIVRGARKPGSTSAIFLSHLDASGDPVHGWDTSGLPVSSRGGDDRPILASDGVGGVFVAWSENDSWNRTGTVRIQRFTSGGRHAVWWPDSGVVVSSGPEWRFVDPGWPGAHGGPILADGQGGVIATWSALETDTLTASAIRLDRNGRLPSALPARGPGVVAFGPNPSKDAGSITLRLPDDGISVVTIHDVSGRRRRHYEIRGAPGEVRVISLDLRGLRSGVYFVRVADRQGRGVSSRKVTIVR